MSKPTPIFFGKIKEGKLSLDNRKSFDLYIASFSDCRVEVVVKKERKTRSLSQNAYYWAVIVDMIVQDTGQDKETIHNWLKTKFNKKTIIIRGVPQEVVESTTKLDTWGFSEEYWEPIRRWAAEFLGLVIPDPQ